MMAARLNAKDHYQAVRKALETVKPQWRNIGLALGIKLSKINEIEELSTLEKKWDGMIQVWLSEDFFGTPSWGALVMALRDSTVAGGKPVAREIEATYITGQAQPPPGGQQPPPGGQQPPPGGQQPPLEQPASPSGTLNQGSIMRKDEAAKAYLQEVKVLLHVANENEVKAVKALLEPPQDLEHDRLVGYIIHPSGDSEESQLVYLVNFGGCKAVLLKTGQGDMCESPLRIALSALPNVKVVIAVGVGYGADSKKQKLGDVLVSEKIIDGRRLRLEQGAIPMEEMVSIHPQLVTVFCDEADEWKDDEESRIECAQPSRYAKACRGAMISGPWLVNHEDRKSELIGKSRNVIGGEMEGCYDRKICDEVRLTHPRLRGVVVIKGVADYADGTKAKGWQPIAATAACQYAKYRLEKLGDLLT